MEGKIIVLLLSMGLMQCVMSDKDLNQNGIYLKVLGQSGKIMVAPEENVAASPDRVTIEMDEIAEKDANGDAVSVGSISHKFNTFANQDFTFSEVTTGELQGVSHSSFTFQASLADVGAELTVTMYMFSEDGTLEFGGESQEVTAGTVKWSIGLTGWTWCNPCSHSGTDYTGAFVDFTITVKSKSDNQEEKTGGTDGTMNIDVGGGATVKLSKKVQVGSTWTDMATNFPLVTAQSSSTMYTFRFTKNNDDGFFYDPSIVYGSAMNVIASPMCLIVCVLAAIFAMRN